MEIINTRILSTVGSLALIRYLSVFWVFFSMMNKAGVLVMVHALYFTCVIFDLIRKKY